MPYGSSPRIGDYVLDELIGAGGMAEVFRATAVAGEHAGQVVALKRLLPDVAERPDYVRLFLSEGEVTRSLDHPAIINVIETGSLNGMHYIAMDFIDGFDLGRIIDTCDAVGVLLPIPFACFVAHTVATALHYAHTATDKQGQPMGIVHCDLTPSNVFISKMGEIHVGDFGVAKSAVCDPMSIMGVVGKAPYLTPEQVTGQIVTPATDVFALGTVFYEMLTNRRAFRAENTDKVWDLVTAGVRPPPSTHRPEISEEIDAVVMRATSPRMDPRDQAKILTWFKNKAHRHPPRYRTADVFAKALEPLYDPGVGTPLAIAGVMRTVFDY